MSLVPVRQRCSIGPDLGRLNNALRTTPPLRTAAAVADGTRWGAPGATVQATAAAVAALVVLALLAVLAPGVAAADTLKLALGKPGHPFGLTAPALSAARSAGLEIEGKSDQTLTLERRVLWSGTASGSAAGGGRGSVQWLADGSALVCTGGEVEVLDGAGSPTWSYTSATHPDLETPSWAWQFSRSDGHRIVIIADSGAGSVFAVDRTAADTPIVWRFSGSGADRLHDPVCAEYVPDGTGGRPTVLIADDDATAPKVLEVDWSNYSVAWRYGGTPGTDAGQLKGPTDVERESDGSTLIADAAANRVIRVGSDGTPLWQYGTGATAGYLSDPLGAGRESNGDIVIADTGNNRVIEVAPDHSIVWSSLSIKGAAGALGQPRLAERAGGAPPSGMTADKVDGALLVCDVGGRHLALIGNTGGGNVSSKTLHLKTGDSQAHWVSLQVDASAQTPTHAWVTYTTSDGVARRLGPGLHSLRGTVSNTIKFTFVLNSEPTDLWLAPSLNDVVLTYTTGKTRASASGNGGATVDIGTAAGAGTSTGSGTGGSGNGSESGAGQGTSTDLGGSGTAASSGATSSGATVTVPGNAQSVASSTGDAAASAVTGIPINVGDLSGGAHGGGGGSPPPRTSRAAVWLRGAAVAALLVSLLVVGPVLVHRRLRRLGTFCHPDEFGGWA